MATNRSDSAQKFDYLDLNTAVSARFANRLVQWQRMHGRNGLPWQQQRDAYAVWVSEVMLQQTQVATVVLRYSEFLLRFPTLQSLAKSHVDEVLALWSGLGYYSRARNLWHCAVAIEQQHAGQFPQDAATLATLPGIGPSTAAAISSLCFGEKVSIFDGNVKRVLARLGAFDGDLSNLKSNKQLLGWAQILVLALADVRELPSYTQGLMDLGATVCVPKRPLCTKCPFMADCKAAIAGDPTRWPVKTKKLKRSAEQWFMLVCLRGSAQDRSVWLEQRPSSGIWAQLHVPLVFADMQALHAVVPSGAHAQPLAAFKHVLTHKDLYLHPHVLDWPVSTPATALNPSDQGKWVAEHALHTVGLPSAVRKIIVDAVNAAESPAGQ